MKSPSYLWLPLIASVIYSIGALYFKKGFQNGAGLLRTFFINNWFLAAGFIPLALMDGWDRPWERSWQPILAGSLFYFGNLFTFLGIRVSDISLVTPILGTKTVFVAFFAAAVIHEGTLPATMWIAALLTALAIFILGWTDFKKGEFISLGILYTIVATAFFGLCDTLVAHWARSFGVFSFSAVMFITAALLSLAVIPFFRAPIRDMPPIARKAIFVGAGFVTLQAVFMGSAIGFFSNPTGVNVIYSSRGLWTLLLVWFAGRHFGNSERASLGRGFSWRFAGAILMTAAIVLAIHASSQPNNP
ncbi:MAG: DMT family transporter [Verrucomicrobia bacterium]|nr:DMT family transporter [Verrucomicrobiota bacterium]